MPTNSPAVPQHPHRTNNLNTYNIPKLGIRVFTLDPLTVRVRVEEERGHVTLRAVGVLVLPSLPALLLDLNVIRSEGINVITITHGRIGGVV
jgi:hypothetical protein